MVALKKGFHPYKLYYFEDYEGEYLSWAWKLPSAEKLASVGGAVCRMAHRTVRCTPDMSGAPATSSVPLEIDRWSSDLWARLDIRWRTGHALFTVRCASMGTPAICARRARIKCAAESRWRGDSRCSVVHRTVRCTPDMSGEL